MSSLQVEESRDKLTKELLDHLEPSQLIRFTTGTYRASSFPKHPGSDRIVWIGLYPTVLKEDLKLFSLHERWLLLRLEELRKDEESGISDALFSLKLTRDGLIEAFWEARNPNHLKPMLDGVSDVL